MTQKLMTCGNENSNPKTDNQSQWVIHLHWIGQVVREKIILHNDVWAFTLSIYAFHPTSSSFSQQVADISMLQPWQRKVDLHPSKTLCSYCLIKSRNNCAHTLILSDSSFSKQVFLPADEINDMTESKAC